MIHIDITLEDIDFDGLIDLYLPLMMDKLRESDSAISRLLSGGMPENLAKATLHKLPPDTKARIAVELINRNSDNLKAEVEQYARENGVGIRIGRITAAI
ncbi:MAG TPA: hypothetical protein DD735_03550 [Clostridiales bacterium]|mgnify:FL=1|jgi:hypothetical protein|nr:hypothetical protein [Clostridiales bacterium]